MFHDKQNISINQVGEVEKNKDEQFSLEKM
jgi:hypothetical protein